MGDDAIFERDIEKATYLDSLRKEIIDLKNKGEKGLFCAEYKADRKGWADPGDYIEKGHLLQVAKHSKEANAFPKQEVTDKLKELTIKKLFKVSDFFKAEEDHVPVLKACATLDALSNIPDAVLSKGAVNSFYRIIYELNSTSNPDEIMGGASAGAENVPKTAFITWRCIRSVLSFRKAFENTAITIRQLAVLLESKPKDVPDDWWQVNSDRTTVEVQVTLSSLRNKGLFIVENEITATKINKNLLTNLANTLSIGATNLKKVKKDMRNIRTYDKGRGAKKNASEITNKLIEIFERASKTSEQVQPNCTSNNFNDVARIIDEAANCILSCLDPTRKYLTSVMDHELAQTSSNSNSNSDIAELLFAADGYGNIRKWDDARIKAAIDKALPSLANNGRFPSHRPFDVAKKGYILHVSGAEVIMAFSNTISQINYPVDGEVVKKLLNHFEETWWDSANGWRHERDHSEGNCYWWLSALSIETLDALRHMVDQQINRLILSHVSIRQPDKLQINLHDLFFPDYGLVAADVRKGGIAIDFQRMLAHVLGAELGLEKLHSVILHGPPGTGKTTLVEALAKSANVPLVEITPSDILLAGEEKIETRARHVFKGLSMLSNVVILFDEFDSILWHREEGGKPESIFQFLTPGMLPKLKNLYDSAKQQRVAFVLSTNYIGSLDEAATREGRFDMKIGVYPPDALSREGRIYCELSAMNKENIQNDFNNDYYERIKQIIRKSSGCGMNRLGKLGWFTRTSKPAQETPMAYILYNQKEPAWPTPEAQSPKEPFKMKKKGEGEDTSKKTDEKTPSKDCIIPETCCKEWNEWKWVDSLDACATKDISSIPNKLKWWKEKHNCTDVRKTEWQTWKKYCEDLVNA